MSTLLGQILSFPPGMQRSCVESVPCKQVVWGWGCCMCNPWLGPQAGQGECLKVGGKARPGYLGNKQVSIQEKHPYMAYCLLVHTSPYSWNMPGTTWSSREGAKLGIRSWGCIPKSTIPLLLPVCSPPIHFLSPVSRKRSLQDRDCVLPTSGLSIIQFSSQFGHQGANALNSRLAWDGRSSYSWFTLQGGFSTQMKTYISIISMQNLPI